MQLNNISVQDVCEMVKNSTYRVDKHQHSFERQSDNYTLTTK